jgi:hypothetical protein
VNLTAGQQRLLQLAERVIAETNQGKVTWRGSNDLTSFSFTTAQGSVIVNSLDGDGQAPYRLSILNTEGTAIESVESVWDTNAGPPAPPAPWNALLQTLYETARSSAVSLDDVIDGILREIEHPTDPDIPF